MSDRTPLKPWQDFGCYHPPVPALGRKGSCPPSSRVRVATSCFMRDHRDVGQTSSKAPAQLKRGGLAVCLVADQFGPSTATCLPLANYNTIRLAKWQPVNLANLMDT